MTITQRHALDTLNSVRNLQVRQLLERIPGCTPSEWVSIATLTGTHKVPSRTLLTLVRSGVLISRPTDGWGPEVKIVDERFIWRQPEEYGRAK